MDTRAEKSAAQVELQQKLQANAEATEFADRELGELTAGASRTERDAVIVVDKGEARRRARSGSTTWSAPRPGGRSTASAPGRRRTRSSSNTWRPIEQQTGEDWTGVDMTLSTAQPQLNATPPELLALDITVVGRGAIAGQRGRASRARPGMAGAAGHGRAWAAWAAAWAAMDGRAVPRPVARPAQEGPARADRQQPQGRRRLTSTRPRRWSRPRSCSPARTTATRRPRAAASRPPTPRPRRTRGRASPTTSGPG